MVTEVEGTRHTEQLTKMQQDDGKKDTECFDLYQQATQVQVKKK